MPGLVDTHIHASQFVNAGTALDLPLLDWLEKYTFPTEKTFQDLDFARKAYSAAVVRVGAKFLRKNNLIIYKEEKKIH